MKKDHYQKYLGVMIMSKLEKYANYYINKYKNREYEYKNNLEF